MMHFHKLCVHRSYHDDKRNQIMNLNIIEYWFGSKQFHAKKNLECIVHAMIWQNYKNEKAVTDVVCFKTYILLTMHKINWVLLLLV